MGFPRQEFWSGLPCPPPGDLPNPGTETVSLLSPALEVGSLPLAPPGKHVCVCVCVCTQFCRVSQGCQDHIKVEQKKKDAFKSLNFPKGPGRNLA